MKKIINKIQIDDLTKLDHHFFIVRTYELLLNRYPDDEGYLNYFKLLNDGHKKIDIFLGIYQSEERLSCNPNIELNLTNKNKFL